MLSLVLLFTKKGDHPHAPIVVVEDQKGVVALLVASSRVRDGHPFPAIVDAPHPKLDRDGTCRPVLEEWQHKHLRSALEV